jgi:hypothetical protein
MDANMIKHEFYELTWEIHGGVVFLRFLPTTKRMTNDDFIELKKVVNNFINAYHTRILFIDGKDFKKKIENSLITKLSETNEDSSSLKWVIHASSEPGIRKMIKVLVNGNVSISEYLSRKELLQVYTDLMAK